MADQLTWVEARAEVDRLRAEIRRFRIQHGDVLRAYDLLTQQVRVAGAEEVEAFHRETRSNVLTTTEGT